jgi:hypothetical protein
MHDCFTLLFLGVILYVVRWKYTDVLQENIASVFRVESYKPKKKAAWRR